MKQEFWEYARVKLDNIKDVYDGDTIRKLTVDCGFGISFKDSFRLYGIDTPEMRPKGMIKGTCAYVEEKQKAIEARDYLRNRLNGVTFRIRTYGKGKYGRWLCSIFIGNENIAKTMITKGLGTIYFGGKK